MSVRGVAGITMSAVLSLSLLGWATDGFAVLTTDAARARSVRDAPRAVPEVTVRDYTGATHAVLDDGFAGGASGTQPRAVIVDFIYTRCITLCSALGGTYQRLQREIEVRGLQDRVRLLTLSFDIRFDDPPHLAMHARVMRAQPTIWSLATPVSDDERELLLDTFGVQVIPDGRGGWVHNAALHVVSPDGQLVRIVNINEPDVALAAALRSWEAGGP